MDISPLANKFAALIVTLIKVYALAWQESAYEHSGKRPALPVLTAKCWWSTWTLWRSERRCDRGEPMCCSHSLLTTLIR